VREIRNEIREFRPNDIRDNRQDYNQRGTPIDPKNDKKNYNTTTTITKQW